MKQFTIAVLLAIFCLAHSNPVPLPEESIDLVNIPLSDNKVSYYFCTLLKINQCQRNYKIPRSILKSNSSNVNMIISKSHQRPAKIIIRRT